jgi:archaellum component FlaC
MDESIRKIETALERIEKQVKFLKRALEEVYKQNAKLRGKYDRE